MKLLNLKTLAVTALALSATLAGCNSDGNHKKWKDNAVTRLDTVKSQIAIQMAEDRFNAGQLALAEQTIEDALSKDLNNPGLWLLAGRISLERSELETAYQRLKKSIDEAEKLENYDRKEKAKPHYYQAIIEQRWQRYEAAKLSYTKAYEFDPENVAYFTARAEMMIQLAEFDQVIGELEGKTKYFDQNATIRALLAHVYRRQGKHDKAAMWFKQASMLAPEDMKLREEVCRSLVATKRYPDAIRALKELIGSEYGQKRTDLHRLLAESFTKAGKLREARDAYTKLTRMDPTSVHDWSRLGELAYRTGDESSALKAANQMIILVPEDHRGYLLAGMIWNKNNQIKRALSMFDRAAELAPLSTTPLIMRGMALQKNDRPAAAADAYKQALKINPKDKRAQHLLSSVTEGLR